MAEIVGGVGTSHVPGIGVAVDRGTTDQPPWRDLFAGYTPAREWIAQARPDVAIIVYNDHGVSLTFDALPTFAIGVADGYPSADQGYGPRPIPPIVGDPDLSWHLVESLAADEFDLAVCQHLPLDHGLTVPMSILWGTPDTWPTRIVPIAVNVIQSPLPTPSRCYRLGQAIRRAIDSYTPDVRVAVVGTGGLSHQLQGTRMGFINPKFDRMFMDTIGPDPDALTAMTVTDYMRDAGTEGAEMIMWLVMRGALGADVTTVYQDYHAPTSNSGAGIVVLTENVTAAAATANAAARA